jgi:hypothetical protein
VLWLKKNKLKVNLDKTKIIQFSNYKSEREPLNIMCNGESVKDVCNTTFLGLVLDKHCNWKAHLENVCTRINKFVFALRKLKKISNMETAITSYHGYVGSVLRYGLLLWGNATHIRKIFIVQKKCVRALSGARPLDSCRPLFKKLSLLTVASLYILEVGIFVKKHPDLFVTASLNKNTQLEI